jgi:phosphomannomutase/phosphoglucomutase
VIEILQKSQKPLKEHFAELPQVYNTPEIKVVCPEQHKFIVIERLVEHFCGEIWRRKLSHDRRCSDRLLGDGAWGIVRASNTSPKITLRFEARTAEKMEEIKNIVLEKLYEQSEIPNES